VQSYVGSQVSTALENKFGTRVSVEKIDIGIFNRLIIDNVQMYDHEEERMLQAYRLSVRIDLLDLLQGKIRISSAQVFGLNANLYQQTRQSKPNFQFILDSLASKDTTSHSPINLQINSLIIRHGSVQWNKRFIAQTPGLFTLDHINIHDISAHIIVNALEEDSANINIKRLAMEEASGLKLKDLNFKVKANHRQAQLTDFHICLPHTTIDIPQISAQYRFENGKLLMPTLEYEGEIAPSAVTLNDIAALIPELYKVQSTVHISTSFNGTSTSCRIQHLNIKTDANELVVDASGFVRDWSYKPKWNAEIRQLRITDKGISLIANNSGAHFKIPDMIKRLGNIAYHGQIGGYGNYLAAKGVLTTSQGLVNLSVGKHNQQFNGTLETRGVNLDKILNDKHLGILSTSIHIKGKTDKKNHLSQLIAKGNIERIDYKGYSYRNIHVDGTFFNGLFRGLASINDANAKVTLQGLFNSASSKPSVTAKVQVDRFNPSALHLTHTFPATTFAFTAKADFVGNNINTIAGDLDLSHFKMHSAKEDYYLDKLHITAGNQNKTHELKLQSDFADLQLKGHFNYETLAQSIINLVGNKLPTLPGLPAPKPVHGNDFTIQGSISKSDWLQHLFHLPVTIQQPITINGMLNDRIHQLNLHADMPQFIINGKQYKNGYIRMNTPNDTLKADIHVSMLAESGRTNSFKVEASAYNNKLATSLHYNNNNPELKIKGLLNTETQFYKMNTGLPAAHMSIHRSDFLIGDSLWAIEPSDIIYYKNHLTVDHFNIRHNDQHILISGLATDQATDSLLVNLQNVNIKYILDLINFHSVEFGGYASGEASLKSVFKSPDAKADLTVSHFTFQDGTMGTLQAHVNYNKPKEQIDIQAIADEGSGHYTQINGWVAPGRNDILLNIGARGTNLDFLKSFCGSFMDQIDARAYGDVQVVGPLSHGGPNLIGDIEASGKTHIAPLNTEYSFQHMKAKATRNKITLYNDTVYDREGHIGIVDGDLLHTNLSKLHYNINIQAQNLLGYDQKTFGNNTFCGTVYATGTCSIRGKSGETIIDIDASPEQGSTFEYNVSSPESVGQQDFIHWHDATPKNTTVVEPQQQEQPSEIDIPSDMKINFLIHANPNLTVKLLMDAATGDYITLHGDGVIHANYFNKGAFNMFGTYAINNGIYQLTIQNIIQKQFQFMPGSSITFSGDPFLSPLQLKAQYTVNGVSLSDLNLGNSFGGGTIRVNCLMNITGTPADPKVNFDMDLPHVDSNIKQMIYSTINGTDEMKQQVVYLLAIGRFYNKNTNNAVAEEANRQSQASLAMQSLISGTISQQFNNVLKTVVHNTNWNFGANISTGDEGWNNAEYEGLLSGRMLNNRLLFNGQFGYRDNSKSATNSSFIGDFDLRYLLHPNGNFAIRVYNQSNDRYFIKNTLNTQGIGLILKKDFNGIHDFFGIKKTKKKNKSKKIANKKENKK